MGSERHLAILGSEYSVWIFDVSKSQLSKDRLGCHSEYSNIQLSYISTRRQLRERLYLLLREVRENEISRGCDCTRAKEMRIWGNRYKMRGDEGVKDQ